MLCVCFCLPRPSVVCVAVCLSVRLSVLLPSNATQKSPTVGTHRYDIKSCSCECLIKIFSRDTAQHEEFGEDDQQRAKCTLALTKLLGISWVRVARLLSSNYSWYVLATFFLGSS